MIAWSIFAVGGVYLWASAPLIAAAAVLAAGFKPRIASSGETRLLDIALIASAAAVALQLVPLPPSFLTSNAQTVRSTLLLSPNQDWQPVSLSPGSTAYALALVLSAMVAFWTARKACAGGAARPLIRAIAIIGLLAAVAAVMQQAGNPMLIYGRWAPRDEGARPFGPFINRNHFATWLLMGFPLAVGYVAAAVSARKPTHRIAAEIAALLKGLGTSATWVAVAAAVMTVGLVASTSRSALIALAVAIVAGAWVGRHRMDRRTRLWGGAGVILIAGAVLAYVNLQPLLLRVEETLAVGAGGRPQIWRETLGVVRDFWITGTGLASYQTAMLVYQRMDRTVFVNQAHNQYLQLLAEGGVLVVIPALIAVFSFVRLFRVRFMADSSPSAWLRIGAVTALIAAAAQSCWETGLRMPANGMLFAVTAAIAVHRRAHTIRQAKE
ncbi:MAG TPA: O-antigen ligase family protein [Lysobacter sp.]|jgi:O-antigen ligase|nr:O-antigen ligase family protein [Lysobacter sp.]